jgi:endonuclease IV
MVKFGFHVSISDSIDMAVDRAQELGCDAFQVFTRNPRSWATRELREGEPEAFRAKRAEAGIDPVYGHMPYILNLASPDKGVYGRSVASLGTGLARCGALGIPWGGALRREWIGWWMHWTRPYGGTIRGWWFSSRRGQAPGTAWAPLSRRWG